MHPGDNVNAVVVVWFQLEIVVIEVDLNVVVEKIVVVVGRNVEVSGNIKNFSNKY